MGSQDLASTSEELDAQISSLAGIMEFFSFTEQGNNHLHTQQETIGQQNNKQKSRGKLIEAIPYEKKSTSQLIHRVDSSDDFDLRDFDKY